MPNRVLVGSHWHVINAEYLAGARAARLSLPRVRGASEAFSYGYENENSGQHCRFGIDLLTAPDLGTSFDIDHAGNSVPYIDRLLAATGAAAVADQIFPKMSDGHPLFSTPADMKRRFLEHGILLSTHACSHLARQVIFDFNAAGCALEPEEEIIAEGLTEARRDLLLAVGDVANDYDGSPQSRFVSYRARRGRSWAAATAQRMARDGQGFLVGITGNGYIKLTRKGWTVYRRLKEARQQLAPAPAMGG
ncbi:conserved hypothetical protein [Hyphomicrobiales bacterium]|jgi:hypothetical protein|nr:conserved hypothetical protein [Hyphomicrobiales bacterium]CAH1702844.1 conserved hypothetical protein [Hyphomicrobiales bacterium]CAI0347032.1 conserved hypothetical protein [Hyphomicrobiales bacterium]